MKNAIKDAIYQSASNYSSRSDFARGQSQFYQVARVNGWLDELFPRYVVGKKLKTVYLLRSLSDPMIYKIGRFPSARVNGHIKTVIKGFQMGFEMVGSCQPRSARAVETMLLATFGAEIAHGHPLFDRPQSAKVRVLSDDERAAILEIMRLVDLG